MKPQCRQHSPLTASLTSKWPLSLYDQRLQRLSPLPEIFSKKFRYVIRPVVPVNLPVAAAVWLTAVKCHWVKICITARNKIYISEYLRSCSCPHACISDHVAQCQKDLDVPAVCRHDDTDVKASSACLLCAGRGDMRWNDGWVRRIL